MPIRLTDERRQQLLAGLRAMYREEFDEELSSFRAERLLDHFLATLGPQVYNQAVQDARAYFQTRLDDLEGEVYQSESF